MSNLLKAEFIKLRRDKVILIAIIITLFFAITNALTYFLIEKLGTFKDVDMGGFDISFTGKGLFTSALSISNNLGLILPVLIVITVCREFSYGTIRNKIISGHSKTNVYFSIFTSSLITGLVIYLFYLLLNLFVGTLLLGYGPEFTMNEFGFVLKTLGLGLIMYSFVIAVGMFIGMIIKNTGLSIVLTIVIMIALTVLSQLYLIPGFPESLKKLLFLLPTYQNYQLMMMNMTRNLNIITIISNIIYLLILSIGGAFLFKKIDLK